MTCRLAPIALALAMLAATGNIAAQEIQPRASISVIHGDNVAPEVMDGITETVGDVAAGLRYRQSSYRWNADVDASLLRREYLEGDYDGENFPRLDGTARWEIAPGRFAWALEDTFGTISGGDPNELRPIEHENQNVFTTGPDLTLPLGDTNTLMFGGRYMKTDFETSTTGNSRYVGQTQIEHQLSALRSIAISYSYNKVTFEEDLLFPEYSVQNAYLHFRSISRRGELTAYAGMAQVVQQDLITSEKSTTSTPSGGLSFDYELSATKSFRFSYAHGYSDASESFRFGDGTLDANNLYSYILPSSQPYISDLASLDLEHKGPRLRIALDGGAEKQRYLEDTTNPDRLHYYAGIYFNYAVGRRTTLGASYTDEYQDSSIPDSPDQYRTTSADAAYQLSINTVLTLRYSHVQRDTHVLVGTENRYELTLAYAPPPRNPPAFTPQLRRGNTFGIRPPPPTEQDTMAAPQSQPQSPPAR